MRIPMSEWELREALNQHITFLHEREEATSLDFYADELERILSREGQPSQGESFQKGQEEMQEHFSDAITFIQHMVEHDHKLYCRKGDGGECVPTCRNGRMALEKAGATYGPEAVRALPVSEEPNAKLETRV